MREPLKFVSDPVIHNKARPLLGTVAQVIENVGRFRDADVGHLVMDTFYGIPELHSETEASIPVHFGAICHRGYSYIS